MLSAASNVPFSAELHPEGVQPSLTDNPSAVLLVDLDGDPGAPGLPDVITTSFDPDLPNAGRVDWFSIDSSGDFLDPPQALAASLPGATALAAGDITQNGLLDVVVGTNEDVRLIRQTEAGVFAAAEVLIQLPGGPSPVSDVVVAYVDDDAVPDLLVAWQRADLVEWYQNEAASPGTFSLRQQLVTFDSIAQLGITDSNGNLNSVRPLDIEVGDLDGDSDLDVVVAAGSADAVLWLAYDPSTLFGPGEQIVGGVDADNVRAVAVANLDGDAPGSLDVAFAANNSDTVGWVANDGSGQFGDTKIVSNLASVADGPFDVTADDIDGDGTMDLLAASRHDDRVSLFGNLGDGQFDQPQIISVAAQALTSTAAVSGDLDGDGDRDVVSIPNGEQSFVWYRNGNVHSVVADFDLDNHVRGDDFGIWEANFGTRVGASIARGDADGDGDVDGDDYLLWQANFSEDEPGGGSGADSGSGAHTADGPLDADFSDDQLVNDDDFVIWEANFGTTAGATIDTGDADGDGDVDGDDYLVWQLQYEDTTGSGGVDGEFNADFNEDTNVNNVDFGIWELNFGTQPDAMLSDGDADGDGDVDGDDYLIWQAQYDGSTDVPDDGGDDNPGGTGAVEDVFLDADFNGDGAVDGDDFDAWFLRWGTTAGARHIDGDADADGDVDGDDFLIWQAQYEGLPAGDDGGGSGGVAYAVADVIQSLSPQALSKQELLESGDRDAADKSSQAAQVHIAVSELVDRLEPEQQSALGSDQTITSTDSTYATALDTAIEKYGAAVPSELADKHHATPSALSAAEVVDAALERLLDQPGLELAFDLDN